MTAYSVSTPFMSLDVRCRPKIFGVTWSVVHRGSLTVTHCLLKRKTGNITAAVHVLERVKALVCIGEPHA